MTNPYARNFRPDYIEFHEMRNMAVEAAVACPMCGAAIGKPCKTSAGHDATYSHASRVKGWRISLLERFDEMVPRAAANLAQELINWLDNRPMTSLEVLITELRAKLQEEIKDDRPYNL